MRIFRIWSVVVLAVLMSGHARAEESGPAPGSLADVCPTPDSRDTVDSVRATVAARLGAPVKEETVGTQYVLTFRQRDGSQLFVMLTRDGDKLEVNCYASKT